jgi:hypothetical protein
MPMNKNQYIQQDKSNDNDKKNMEALSWCGKTYRWEYLVHDILITAT